VLGVFVPQIPREAPIYLPAPFIARPPHKKNQRVLTGWYETSIMKLFASLLFLLIARFTSSQQEHESRVCSSEDGTCSTMDNNNVANDELIIEEPQQVFEFPIDFVDPCTDNEVNCPIWAREGECRANPSYMLRTCAGSCGTCQFINNGKSVEEEELQPVCIDKYDQCNSWANEDGECWINPDCKLMM
jgi:hypothetical protein